VAKKAHKSSKFIPKNNDLQQDILLLFCGLQHTIRLIRMRFSNELRYHYPAIGEKNKKIFALIPQ
jgi:hypothetical protein